MKGPYVAAHIARFSDLALLCPRLVTPESKKVERFIWGFMPPTQGSVLDAKALTFDSAKRLTQALIDHGDNHKPVAAAHKPPKERGGKRKLWNKRKVK